MRKKLPKILVTGGAGFIGSACVKALVKTGINPLVIDSLTYAGDLSRLKEISGKLIFYKADICARRKIESIFAKERPEIVLHFAAETHVDRSILDSDIFIRTNLEGTRVLLETGRKYKIKKFIFISTDEVYGQIKRGKFTENAPLKPGNFYAASKAAADLLVQSYIRDYKFPAVIIRPSNTYGPWQYPEKLISLGILRILNGEKIPVYGRGQNQRQWLYIDDCVAGILAVMQKGKAGQVYNLGGISGSRNIDTVKLLLAVLGADSRRVEFVKDRPGHDLRYSLDTRKISRQTGWKPKIKIGPGLKHTVKWSREHQCWLKSKLPEINKLYR